MTSWGIIYGWMQSSGITGLQELAERTGISYGTLKIRKKIPQEFRARELDAIKRITGMTKEDYYLLTEAAGEGR